MKILLILLVVFPFLGMAKYDEEAFARLLRNGAVAKYVYRVVDDEGIPVSNATCHIWFRSYGRPQDEAGWVAETDTNGIFVAEHRLNEKFSVGIDKVGYYHTHDEINYFEMSAEKRLSIVKDDKWQPYGELRTVILKRIRKPVRLLSSGNLQYYKYPPLGRWVGFDLCKRDWAPPPYGNGEFSDAEIRFEKNITEDGYVKTMEVTFTNNPFAGAYEVAVDSFSDLKSVYRANTNALFSGVFKYTFKRGKGGPERNELEEGRYLVFRSRTKVDRDGVLLSAHYGIIFGDWRFFEKGGMAIEGLRFNPTPNDTNLEDAETARRSQLGYRQRQELEWRRKNGRR